MIMRKVIQIKMINNKMLFSFYSECIKNYDEVWVTELNLSYCLLNKNR